MKQNQTNRKPIVWNSIILLFSVLGLIACIAVLFPQIRQMIFDYLARRVVYKKTSINQVWDEVFLKFAIVGIIFILFFDYCTLSNSGKSFIQKLKQGINDCLREIDFRSFLKPSFILLGVYLLGILTIIRANYAYIDDVWREAAGFRQWFIWSRYVSEVLSIFIHGDTRLTDISPMPQLLAAVFLTASSVILVYVLTRKITVVRLLACIPLGLSPYFLECLSYKFDAPYMALSVLASVFPFLFIARKKIFLFISIISLLIMCMTYQAASGIYLMIVVILCFHDWNSRRTTVKEIYAFGGIALFAFCFAMLFFKFVLMKPTEDDFYALTALLPAPQIISGALNNIKDYVALINHDFGIIWKTGIIIVLLFFIAKSVRCSAQRKILSFFISILAIAVSFILSYGLYILLAKPLYAPRAMFGFGVFLAILCIYVVTDYKKLAVAFVFALNWCFFIFAFSYGNALAEQARYANFRISIILHDISVLYPDANKDIQFMQFDNSVDLPPSIKNIAKNNPVIERLVPNRLSKGFLDYFHSTTDNIALYINDGAFNLNQKFINLDSLNLPVVLDSYYHTVKGDRNHVLIVLKH